MYTFSFRQASIYVLWVDTLPLFTHQVSFFLADHERLLTMQVFGEKIKKKIIISYIASLAFLGNIFTFNLENFAYQLNVHMRITPCIR